MKNEIQHVLRSKSHELIGLQLEEIFVNAIQIQFDGSMTGKTIPDYGNIYFKIGKAYLRISETEFDLSISVSMLNSLEYTLILEEGELPTRLSISHLILLDALTDTRIERVVYYGKAIVEGSQIATNALSLFLVNGQEIFIDSCSTLGLKIGGESRRLVWIENAKIQPGYSTEVVFNYPTIDNLEN